MQNLLEMIKQKRSALVKCVFSFMFVSPISYSSFSQSFKKVSSPLKQVQVRSLILPFCKSRSGHKSFETSLSQVSSHLKKFKSSLESFLTHLSQVWNQLESNVGSFERRLVSSYFKKGKVRSDSDDLWLQSKSALIFPSVAAQSAMMPVCCDWRMSVMCYLWGRVENRLGWRDWRRSCCSCGLESRSEKIKTRDRDKHAELWQTKIIALKMYKNSDKDLNGDRMKSQKC